METLSALPIPGDWIVQGGAVGMLAFVALLLFLGWLVPRSTYRQLERDRDYWRTVALKSIGHTDALIPAAQITTEVTRALGGDAHATRRALGDMGTVIPATEGQP